MCTIPLMRGVQDIDTPPPLLLLFELQLWLVEFLENITGHQCLFRKWKTLPCVLGTCRINTIVTCQLRNQKKQKDLQAIMHQNKQTLGVSYFQNQDASALSERRVCVFKEGINLASYTFACFLAPKPDLWTASEEPPGTVSSLHNIWLVFQWSKRTRHYESNADENMFSRVNQQAFGGEERRAGGGGKGVVERIWVTSRGMMLWFIDAEIQTGRAYYQRSRGFKQIHITCADLSSLLCFKVIFRRRHWRKIK